jgi:hypothetical protein
MPRAGRDCAAFFQPVNRQIGRGSQATSKVTATLLSGMLCCDSPEIQILQPLYDLVSGGLGVDAHSVE